MTFDGSEYLIIIDYYSKMPIVWKMPTSQCNSAKIITVLKELFAEHGIPEEIQLDNGPQFASHLFAEFTKDWNIKHSTSSPMNPRSNGQADSAVKINNNNNIYFITFIQCFYLVATCKHNVKTGLCYK